VTVVCLAAASVFGAHDLSAAPVASTDGCRPDQVRVSPRRLSLARDRRDLSAGAEPAFCPLPIVALIGDGVVAPTTGSNWLSHQPSAVSPA
jgi:hypothetical protein